MVIWADWPLVECVYFYTRTESALLVLSDLTKLLIVKKLEYFYMALNGSMSQLWFNQIFTHLNCGILRYSSRSKCVVHHDSQRTYYQLPVNLRFWKDTYLYFFVREKNSRVTRTCFIHCSLLTLHKSFIQQEKLRSEESLQGNLSITWHSSSL